MNNKKTYLIFIFILGSLISFGQKNKYIELSGSVVDSTSLELINYATIQLVDNSTNKLIYGAITDTVGCFKITNVECEKYTFIISFLGYKTKKIDIDLTNKKNYYYLKIGLVKDSYQLEGVEIIGEQKGSKTEIDKTIFIPDSLSLANSKTGLDLLKKAPGVTVRKSDQSIKVMGSSNVLILIDGSNSNRNINAIDPKDIERIEVIDNPSAKYDSDVANVLNIILKEDRKKGLKLSTTLTYFHSDNYRSFNTFNIEYEFLKIRVFGMYKNRIIKTTYIDTTNRISNINNIEYHNISYSFDNSNKSLGHTFQYGVDYYINKKNLINFTGNYEILGHISNRNNITNYYENSVLNAFLNDNINSNRDNILQNYTLFYRRIFNKKEQELTFNTNYYIMNRNYYAAQKSDLYNFNNNSNTKSERITETNNRNDAINSKLDYSHPFSKNIHFDIGTQLYYRNIENKYQTDNELSLFDYQDLRSAFYGVATIKGKKISFQSGIRAERFNICIYDSIQFTQWNYLPNISILYKINLKNKLKLIVNEKLKYPRFYMLTPFTYYSNDSLSISSGNPYLKPEKYINFELNYSYKKKYTFLSSSISYKRNNNLLGIKTSIDNNNVMYEKYDNITYSEIYETFIFFNTVLLGGIIQVSLYNSLSYNVFQDNKYNGLTYRTTFSSEIQLPLDMYITIDASYFGKNYTFSGYSYETPIIDEISITKSILKDRGEITIGLIEYFIPFQSTDIVWDNNYKNEYNYYSNQKALLFRFNYFFRKGKKLKKVNKELNMERDDK
jgi:hypothetical protein